MYDPSQSAIAQWDWVFHNVRGGFDPRDHRFRPLVVGLVDVWRDFWYGDRTLSSPRGASFIFEPQPISDRPAGLGFLHCAGRFRPGRSPFSSPGCRSCRCIKGFPNRGLGPILPEGGDIVGFPEGQFPPRAPRPLIGRGRAEGGKTL